ncbi:hypothetical protein QJ850_gp927 [Acanthamoeba polyphaga mimivirus]|uniref:Uncharacterized protein n=1 Tax=Acanthamoeba polyphaga mimivirus Kroon TaxID=3069720 RepID=A0A0G2Y7I0_9VIRU|nr:hypothetical protein QJ850_gp927 [Acanthamoeba polyphaga mimivirus]AKI79772.1 hypothetical protein [Acanthamoeba polyphaga mimivirus Kroon]
MENNTKNYLEFIIEKNKVNFFKRIIEIVCGVEQFCKIFFDSSNISNNGMYIIEFTPYYNSGELNTNTMFRLKKSGYFFSKVPKTAIIVDSELLSKCFRRLSVNDDVIVYIKDTGQLFAYNLDNNNNQY